jgi:hypothetical protein
VKSNLDHKIVILHFTYDGKYLDLLQHGMINVAIIVQCPKRTVSNLLRGEKETTVCNYEF